MPALIADFQEMRLELPGYEFLLRADEVQHRHDLAIGRKRARRGGYDDGGGRHRHEEQHADAGEFEKPRQTPDFITPVAMVVQKRAGILRLENFLEGGDLGRIVAVDLHRDEPWNCETLKHVRLADPWLDKLEGLLAGEWRDPLDAVLVLEEFRDIRDLLLAHVAGARLDLNGDLRRDILRPDICRIENQIHAAGGQRREKAHDCDHERQRPAGDRAGRHNGRVRPRELSHRWRASLDGDRKRLRVFDGAHALIILLVKLQRPFSSCMRAAENCDMSW